MYNYKRKIANPIRLMALLLLLSLLCACGSTPKTFSNSNAADAQSHINSSDEAIEITKESSYYPFEPGYKVKRIAALGSSMIILGSNDVNNSLAFATYESGLDNGISITYNCYCSLYDREAADEQYLYDAATDGEFFYVLAGELPASRYDKDSHTYVIYNQDFSGKFSILRYSEQGEYLSKLQFSCLPSTDASVRGFLALGKGGYIVYTFDECFLFSKDGTLECTIRQDDLQFFGIQACAEGVVASCFQNGIGFCTLLIDQDGNSSITACPEASLCSCQSFDGQFLLNTGKYFCNYDFASESRKDILLWNSGEKIGSDCTCVVQLSDSVFIYTMNDSEAFYVITNVEQPIGEHAVVHIARCGSAINSPSLALMNSLDSRYVYQYEDYSDQEMDRLMAEIISGNGPDLIVFNNNLDTASSLFEDLYAFLDKDSFLSRDSFLPNYLSTLEINGELHELWTGCSIITLSARASDVGDGKALTTADYDRILAENDNYEAIFDNYMTKDELLKWIADISLGEYVDKETGTCHFTDPSFADLIAWCGKMTNGFGSGETAWGYDISQVILTTLWLDYMPTVHDLWIAYGEQPVFVGFPSNNGYGNYYSSPYGNCCMAIPKASHNKDGAWTFIREQLLTEKQMTSSFFPVNYEAFQRMAHASLNEEECDSLFVLLHHTTKSINYSDHKLEEIIVSAGTAYMNGEKSLDETVDLIQSRASIYISERYGW